LLFLFVGNSVGTIIAGDIAGLLRNIVPLFILLIIYLTHKFMFQTKVIKLEDINLDNKYE
ncbi:gamma-aminobutyrate permease, partial [Staphylococcus arlettae]|nr:gamma-aminobutyrate permease [Staphylococcus arlettae]